MDMAKIKAIIEKGFNKFFNSRLIERNVETFRLVNAINSLTEHLGNAFKGQAPTEEDILVMVNRSVQRAKAGDKVAFRNAIKEGTKNLITRNDLRNEINCFTNDFEASFGVKIINSAFPETKQK